jgi:hypothetical protein
MNEPRRGHGFREAPARCREAVRGTTTPKLTRSASAVLRAVHEHPLLRGRRHEQGPAHGGRFGTGPQGRPAARGWPPSERGQRRRSAPRSPARSRDLPPRVGGGLHRRPPTGGPSPPTGAGCSSLLSRQPRFPAGPWPTPCRRLTPLSRPGSSGHRVTGSPGHQFDDDQRRQHPPGRRPGSALRAEPRWRRADRGGRKGAGTGGGDRGARIECGAMGVRCSTSGVSGGARPAPDSRGCRRSPGWRSGR